MPFKPTFQITFECIKAISEIEYSQGFIKAQRLHDLSQRKAIEQTDPIEGIDFSKMISKINPENRKELETYRKAFGILTHFFLTKGSVNEKMICEMHHYLFAGAIKNPGALGKYRSFQNHIYKSETKKILFTPSAPAHIGREMRDLLDWLDNEKNIPFLIKIILFHLQFLNIHPFSDGNGRTGQLLTMVLLHKSGYEFKDYFALGERYLIDRNQYHDAIQSCQTKRGDMTIALEYILKGLSLQMREVRNLLETSLKVLIKGKKIEETKPLAGRSVFFFTSKS